MSEIVRAILGEAERIETSGRKLGRIVAGPDVREELKKYGRALSPRGRWIWRTLWSGRCDPNFEFDKRLLGVDVVPRDEAGFVTEPLPKEGA